MRTVKLGTVKIRGETAPVAKVLVSFLEATPMGGLSLAQVRMRLRLIDKIESEKGDTVDLLPEEHDALKFVMENGQYGMADAGLVEVADRVIFATEAPVTIEEAR